MEKMTGSYELLFFIKGTLSQEEAAAVQEKFTTLIAENGELVKVDEWGKRRLAYPIDKINEGYYVLVAFKSTTDFPAELDRLLGINDAVLRAMTMRVEEAKSAPIAAEEAPAAETVTE